MTDNFSASFGKSGNVNVTNDISPRKHPASGQSKLSDYKCNKIQVDHDAIEIISNEKILSTAYQSFGLTDMKILSDRKIFCRSEKKAPKNSLSCA
jgi:hypothetical protein